MNDLTTGNNARLFVKDWGAGRPVTCLHGWLPPCDAWGDQAMKIAEAGCRTIECAKAFATTDFRRDLASFKVPTLVIQGTDDRTVPIDASGRAAAAGIAHATLIEYEGAAHGLFSTHKDRLTSDLLHFIGS